MVIDVQVRAQGRAMVVRPRGELDLGSADRFGQALVGACRAGLPLVVLDLGKVRFMDSLALGVLVAASRSARALACRIVVAGARPVVARVFELTALDDLFEVQREGVPWPWPEAVGPEGR